MTVGWPYIYISHIQCFEHGMLWPASHGCSLVFRYPQIIQVIGSFKTTHQLSHDMRPQKKGRDLSMSLSHLRMDPLPVCKQLCVNQFSTAPNAQSSDSAAADRAGSPEMGADCNWHDGRHVWGLQLRVFTVYVKKSFLHTYQPKNCRGWFAKHPFSFLAICPYFSKHQMGKNITPISAFCASTARWTKRTATGAENGDWISGFVSQGIFLKNVVGSINPTTNWVSFRKVFVCTLW